MYPGKLYAVSQPITSSAHYNFEIIASHQGGIDSNRQQRVDTHIVGYSETFTVK